MNKKFIVPLMVMAVIGLVVAGVYVVNTLSLTVGVNEAFVISYAVIGDAGTYTEGTCAGLSEEQWFTSDSQSIPAGGFYPLESRRVCVRIQNLGEVDIPYVIEAIVTNDNPPNNDCANAFGTPYTLTGTAINQGNTYRGVTVQIGADATPVSECNVVISVGRGTVTPPLS